VERTAAALRPRSREIAAIVLLAVGQAVTLVTTLLLLRRLVDALASGDMGQQSIFGMLWALLAVVLANSALRGYESAYSEIVGYELVRRLRMVMHQHLQGMSPRQVQGRSRGALILRFTGDLSMLRTWISRGLARAIVSSIVLAAGIGVLAYLNMRLAVTILAVMAFGAAVLVLFGPKLAKQTRAVRRKRSLVSSNITEQIHTLAVVQVSGRSGGERDRLARQNDSLTKSLVDTALTRGAMQGVSSATAWLAIAAVLAIGTLEVMAGNASVGIVATAMLAVRQLGGPIRRLGLAYDYWQRAGVSRRKLVDFLESSSRPLEDPDMPGITVGKGAVSLEGVSVDGSLHGINAQSAGNSIVALIGPNGAGKSTLLGVIAGIVDPSSGRLTIDGHPAAERTLASRYRRIGMVGPDLPLMTGTVRRNLTYRRPTATAEEIERVVALCRLDDIVDQLPGGMSFWVVEGGRNLSVGQRQRVALGRALLANPAILLLDEPTVNLDAESTDVMHSVILHHRGAVFIATHDEREAALADEVWVMESGRIIETLSGDEYRDRVWRAGMIAERERRDAAVGAAE
jgi:ABC-type multidrug transport system fused ATPase/permease subunit